MNKWLSHNMDESHKTMLNKSKTQMKVQNWAKLFYAEFQSQASGDLWGLGSDWNGNQVGLVLFLE